MLENSSGNSFHLSRRKIFFEVEDTGVGITENKLKTLFVKCFNRNKTENELFSNLENGNFGLGLTISYLMVMALNQKKSGCTLLAESTEGLGSKFTFPISTDDEFHIEISEKVIPFRRNPFVFQTSHFNFPIIEELGGMISKKNNTSFASGYRRETNVLIVDDDQINLLVATNYLHGGSNNKQKFKFETANNGKEALSLVLQKKKEDFFFDIILMDLNMPIMDGFEAASEIKALELSDVIPPTPIIAITANTGTVDKAKCLKYGMENLLYKPYKKQELISLIEQALNKKK